MIPDESTVLNWIVFVVMTLLLFAVIKSSTREITSPTSTTATTTSFSNMVCSSGRIELHLYKNAIDFFRGV